MPGPISVLIADDHAFSSVGLQRLLEAEPLFEVLPPVGNGLDAIALARVEAPGLAVLDYAMPGANGIETMQEIRRWSPGTRVAILTGSTARALIDALVAAQSDGLFLKSADPDAIVAGLRRVAQGDRVLGEGIGTGGDAAVLSRRELEILGCIADGLTNSGTAARLSISIKTVESHRASLMRKMEVHSTASLMVKAVQQGLIAP